MAARILYVEDNPQNMRLVRKILTAAGYDVLEAVTGQTGMEVVDSHRPDLVLMDVNLPDINGLEATTRLKANPELRSIPIVALTANAMHGDRESCLAAGCDGYLAKPVMKTELLNTVAFFLKQTTTSSVNGVHPASQAE